MRLPPSCLALAAAMLLPACSTLAPAPAQPTAAADTAPPAATDAPASIAEAWIAQPRPADEIDSLATWPAPDGGHWLIATAKSSNTLAVYDADTGDFLRSVGGPGDGPGRFRRPNGIAVFGDVLFVAERDGRRVQMLRLPDFAPLGSFGGERLRVPYGLWVNEVRPDVVDVYVTDSYMADFRIGLLPPMDELSGRVKRFRVDLSEQTPQAAWLDQFGDTGEAGALRMVESIAGDPAHDRLLIADEDRRVGSTLREYGLSNQRYRGRSLPAFKSDAEGVALWACTADSGYWIAVDQVRPSEFRVYDRRTLALAGTFSGHVVADTDGIVLQQDASARFPAGALFAQHDNVAVAAFDLRDVVRTLRLDPACAE